MPTKTGNKIDYTEDNWMNNGGFAPMGFGRLPSQQVKVDEKNELGNLIKDYRSAIAIIFAVMSLLYVSINLMFGKSDMYEVVNISEIVLWAVGFILMNRVMFQNFDGRHVFGDENGMYLNTNTIISFIFTGFVFLYIHINTTDFLVVLFRFPEERDAGTIISSVLRTALIFFTIAMIAPSIAIVIRLVFGEILDKYHSAIEIKTNQDKLALDWAKFQEDNERYWNGHGVIDQLPSAAPQKLLGHHIITNPAAARLIAPRTEDQYFNMLVNEFLDGIENGQWSTSERSWKRKRLVRSGVDLPVVGDSIRDALISGGWAQWQHPNQPHLGWSLVAPISEIRNKALLPDKKQLPPPEESEAPSPAEWNPEDEQ